MSNKTTVLLTTAAAVISAAFSYYLYTLKTKKTDESSSSTFDPLVLADLQEVLKLPLIDISLFFNRDKNRLQYIEECKKVADALHDYGVLVIKDPRVNEIDNGRFIDMMEKYFESSDGVRDARPEHSFQVGVTPEGKEKPRDHSEVINKLAPDQQPLSSKQPSYDPKWRFFWRIGPQIPSKLFPCFNPDPVIPVEIPEWKDVMDMWGNKMLDAVMTVARMAAEGFDMEPEAFTSRLSNGPHLLAPTGSNFNKYGKLGTVLAGFHSDLNFLTIHGKSRYPGLSVWTREGKRVGVAVPDGYLLVQAGKEIEYLTGGYVHAGYHEVLVNKSTIRAIEESKAKERSLWRVSSTLFSHIQYDQMLCPLPPFDTVESRKKFPEIYTGEFVRRELQAIALDSWNK